MRAAHLHDARAKTEGKLARKEFVDDAERADMVNKEITVVSTKPPVQVERVEKTVVLSATIPLETLIEKTMEKKLALIRGGL